MTAKNYTKGEERANVITHALGIAMGIVMGGMLICLALNTHDRWAIFSVWVYVIFMTLSYVSSVLYHSSKDAKRKKILRRFDHAAIYFHIAGTYTPFTLIVLRHVGLWGWSLFSIVWLAATVGTVLSFTHQKAGSKLETICYVLMGSVIFVAFKPLIDTFSASGMSLDAVYWLIAGGISYLVGAILYSFKNIRYMHSVFHLFVLGGSLCHILAIRNIFL